MTAVASGLGMTGQFPAPGEANLSLVVRRVHTERNGGGGVGLLLLMRARSQNAATSPIFVAHRPHLLILYPSLCAAASPPPGPPRPSRKTHTRTPTPQKGATKLTSVLSPGRPIVLDYDISTFTTTGVMQASNLLTGFWNLGLTLNVKDSLKMQVRACFVCACVCVCAGGGGDLSRVDARTLSLSLSLSVPALLAHRHQNNAHRHRHVAKQTEKTKGDRVHLQHNRLDHPRRGLHQGDHDHVHGALCPLQLRPQDGDRIPLQVLRLHRLGAALPRVGADYIPCRERGAGWSQVC